MFRSMLKFASLLQIVLLDYKAHAGYQQLLRLVGEKLKVCY